MLKQENNATMARLIVSNFTSSNFWYDRIRRKQIFNKGNFVGDELIMSHFVLWPVPTAIDANSLGVINQNEGYTGFETTLNH